MHNIKMVIKPEETRGDFVAALLEETECELDDPFIFSAIYDPKTMTLKLNCTKKNAVYSINNVVATLFQRIVQQPEQIHYMNAPLEKWLIQFKPTLHQIVESVYPAYYKLYPDKQDLLSILFITVIKLYNKGYYLHKYLIRQAFIKDLNMSIRKQKHFTDCQSLDAPNSQTDPNLTIGDMIADPTDIEEELEYKDWVKYMFGMIKEEMLRQMSQLSFDMMMIQIENKTIDSRTSKMLAKMRDKFASDYKPRPNARRNKEDDTNVQR